MLLNYTTKISAQKTTGEIMEILAKHGARAVRVDYGEGGIIEGLSFNLKTDKGDIGIRLPVKPEAVLRVMESTNIAKHYCNSEQATRVAWRIAKDWIKAQMAIIETGMVKMEQVFLPYWVMPDGSTLYEHYVGTGFQLTQGGNR